MNPTLGEILRWDREAFLSHLRERLASLPPDYGERMAHIRQTAAAVPSNIQAAGVLVPLHFDRGSEAPADRSPWTVFLIKRAAATLQSGDLGFPGGLIHPSLDACLRPLLSSPFLPIVPMDMRRKNRRRDPATWHLISLLLTTALRESWEEIGLHPWRVAFQGPLPTYSLRLFRRTIFPLVGWIRRPRRLQANASEVEKIVPLPLAAFTQEEHFGRLVLVRPDGRPGPEEESSAFPCLILPQPGGGREVLWGATFQILLRLLGVIADYRLPDPLPGPVVCKRIGAAYLTGTPSS